MKKYSNKFTAVLMMCLMLVTSIAFTSCDDGTDIDTNQFKGGVHLNAFGPCPVLRGGELRFIGSGLDKINSITLPGAGEITDIQVVSPGEIRIVVPQNAEPGLVVLNHAGGKITTLTELTFLEPIEITGIAPNPVKPGQELTITGDYLNLMKEVCFPFDEMGDSVNVYAEDFVEHTRTTIKVVVPAEARGGVLKLSTAEEVPNVMPFEEEELVVVLPAPEAVLDLTDAKPGQEVTVKGTDLDLVTKMQIDAFTPEAQAEGRANDADDIEFAYDAEKSTITFNLPENAHDGVIVFVTASGVKVACANIGMVIPTEVKAVPADGLRGGDVITISGVNMDQVTDVVFPNVEKAVEPSSVSATEVKVVMPADAQSGDITLNLKSGKTVTVAIATAKPENIAYNPAPAPAGNELTVTGRNLDLVKTVVFTDGVNVEVKDPTATELKVTVPLTAASGMVKFVMTNGESVEGPELTVELPSIAYISQMPAEDAELAAGTIMKVGIANESLLTGVKVNGEDVQYILNGTDLYINLPATAGKNTVITLVSGDQSLDYTFDVIPATHVENVIFDQMIDLSWSGDEGVNKFRLYKESFEGVPVGAKLVFHIKPGAEAQIQVNNANWGEIVTLKPAADDEVAELELTSDVLNTILTTEDGWSTTALVIQGQNCIVNKVALEWENSLEVTLWEPNQDMGDYAINLEMNVPTAFVDAGVKVGSTVRFYMTPTAAPNLDEPNIHLQIFDGHWGGLTFPEIDGGGQFNEKTWGDMTCVAITVDQTLYEKLTTLTDWGYCLIFQGRNIILNKVTLE